jgi:hypothetical protein
MSRPAVRFGPLSGRAPGPGRAMGHTAAEGAISAPRRRPILSQPPFPSRREIRRRRSRGPPDVFSVTLCFYVFTAGYRALRYFRAGGGIGWGEPAPLPLRRRYASREIASPPGGDPVRVAENREERFARASRGSLPRSSGVVTAGRTSHCRVNLRSGVLLLPDAADMPSVSPPPAVRLPGVPVAKLSAGIRCGGLCRRSRASDR